jgi:TATA-binding protein-associated factor Taf7
MGGVTGCRRKVEQRKGKEKTKEMRKERRKGKKGKETEEEEAEVSGMEEEDVGWDRSDPEHYNDMLANEEEVEKLQSSIENEHPELPFCAKPIMKY